MLLKCAISESTVERMVATVEPSRALVRAIANSTDNLRDRVTEH